MVQPKPQQAMAAVELCADRSSLSQIIETENMMDRIVNGLSESSIKVRLAAVRWACPRPCRASACHSVCCPWESSCWLSESYSELSCAVGSPPGERGSIPGLVQFSLGCSQAAPCLPPSSVILVEQQGVHSSVHGGVHVSQGRFLFHSRCLHSLSRSVQQLRTSFQDHAVWKPLMKVSKEQAGLSAWSVPVHSGSRGCPFS